MPNPDPAHRPPCSPEAELHVLGCMLKANKCIDDVAAILRPDDFYTDANQRLFTAILDANRGGRPVDAVILADKVKELGWIDDVGGYPVFASLWSSVVTAGNVEYYARIVRDKSMLRGLILAGTEMIQAAHAQAAPPEQIVDDAARLISNIEHRRSGSNLVWLDAAMNEAIDAIDRRLASGRMPGLPTGLSKLDQMTSGFRKRELTILGARPSRGKTAISLTFSTAGAWAGEPVLFASCEQSRIEIAERILAAEAKLDLRAIRSHRMPEQIQNHLVETRNTLAGLPLVIDDSRRQSSRHIARQARRVKRNRGLAMVVVDYVGLMAVEERRDRKRYEAVGELARDMRDLAGELDVPVILLSQLNRGAEERGKDARPVMADLRESGDLEQHADLVILLHVPRDHKDDAVWPLELLVEKQRNGPTGSIIARFNKSQMRFEDEAA